MAIQKPLRCCALCGPFFKENDVMAYLTMMAIRLLELYRVSEVTGSLYLHCDPTASHYLKILLDAIFGKATFGKKLYGNVHMLIVIPEQGKEKILAILLTPFYIIYKNGSLYIPE